MVHVVDLVGPRSLGIYVVGREEKCVCVGGYLSVGHIND